MIIIMIIKIVIDDSIRLVECVSTKLFLKAGLLIFIEFLN